eukprot:COSAG02_NODE_54240_length_297_cov_0.777778_1_plen_65_part_01
MPSVLGISGSQGPFRLFDVWIVDPARSGSVRVATAGASSAVSFGQGKRGDLRLEVAASGCRQCTM